MGGGGGGQYFCVLDNFLDACLLRYNVFAVVSGVEEKPVRLLKGKFKEMTKVG